VWFWGRFINCNMLNKKNMKSTELIKKLILIIEKETDKKIDIDKNFIQNDMDSLDMMSIAMGIEKKFKCKISDKDLNDIKKVQDLEKLLVKKLR